MRDGCRRRPRGAAGIRVIHGDLVHAAGLGSDLFSETWEITVLELWRRQRTNRPRRPRARSGAVTRQLVERSMLEICSFAVACARAASVAVASNAPTCARSSFISALRR